MDIVESREAIETRFRDCWMLDDPNTLKTPVGWDGQPFEPPTDANSVRLSILDGSGTNASMGSPGSNLVRYAGVVHLQLFVPAGREGLDPSVQMRSLIRDIVPIFTNWKSGGLLFRTMNIGTRQEDQPFLIQAVTFPFQRDEFHG